MTQVLIPRSDICMSDAMPFSQHWEARVAAMIEDIDDLGFALQTAYASFKPGDLVNICAYANNRWERLVEVASFRIVSCDNRKIETVLVTPITRVPAARFAPGEVDPSKLVKVNVGKSWEVRDERGNILEAFVDEKQAQAFIDAAQRPVKQIQEDPIDFAELSIKRGFQGRFSVIQPDGTIVKECKNKAEAEAFIADGQQKKVA